MKQKNILKDAGVVLVALLMVLTTLVVAAHTTNNGVVQKNDSAGAPLSMDRLTTLGKTVQLNQNLGLDDSQHDFVVKPLPVTQSSDQIFARAYGGTGYDFATSMTQPIEGGDFAVTGVWDYYGACDAFIAKYDTFGNKIWVTGLGGPSPCVYTSFSVIQTSDGNFVITGETNLRSGGSGDILLAKFNTQTGSLIWGFAIGGVGWDRGLSVIEDHSGDFIVTGVTTSFSSTWDLFIAKFTVSNSGVCTCGWVTTVDGPSRSSNEIGSSVAQKYESTTSGYYFYVTGWTTGGGPGKDILLAKFDKSGNKIWANAYGGSGDDVGEAVVAEYPGFSLSPSWFAAAVKFNTEFDGVFVTGYTTGFGAIGKDLFVAMFNDDGSVSTGWLPQRLGGPGDQEGSSITINLPHILYMPNFASGLIQPPYMPSQIVVAGSTVSSAGDEDALVAGFDLWRNSCNWVKLQWARSLSGPAAEGFSSVKPGIVAVTETLTSPPVSIGFTMPSGRLFVAGATNSWGSGQDDILLGTLDPYGHGCEKVQVINPPADWFSLPITCSNTLIVKTGLSFPSTTPISTPSSLTNSVTPRDVAGGVLVEHTDLGDISDPVYASFAIITDIHLHTGSLQNVVNWIIANKVIQKIQFVMVLGDLTDENPDPNHNGYQYNGYIDNLNGVKTALQPLNVNGVPYIPLIGNHDVWYDGVSNIPSGTPEKIFNDVFSPQYTYLSSFPDWDKQITNPPPYLQNFAFTKCGYHFICLDTVSRRDYGMSAHGWPDIYQTVPGGTKNTWDWFTNHITTFISSHPGSLWDKKILIFSHYPVSCFDAPLTIPPMNAPIAFTPTDYEKIGDYCTQYSEKISKWFAGHVHIPLEETILSEKSPIYPFFIFDTVVTAAISPWAPEPLNQHPFAPALRLVRLHLPWYLEPGAPQIPQITGPASGNAKTVYDYNIMTTDPQGDQVFYFIDWGDNTSTGWIGPYTSGETVTQSHTWSAKGNYTITAKAKDTAGHESDWATFTVTMPCSFNKPMPQFLEWLFQRFPHAFPILRHLLGY